MTTQLKSELRSELANIIGHSYDVPTRIRSRGNKGCEVEGPAVISEVLNTVLIPLYDSATGELVAAIERDVQDGRNSIRIDVVFENESGASGYKTLTPGRWCVVDNEGRGHCMYSSVRDAFLASTRSKDDPSFLSARTRTGKETPHAYVKALRSIAAEHASKEEMEVYLHHYFESQEAVEAARCKLSSAKNAVDRHAAELELSNAREFAENFKHMRQVAEIADPELRFEAYKKKLAARTCGDETAIERLECATGSNIVVIGPSGQVQNAARRNTEELERPTVILEYIPGAPGTDLGHYVLVGRNDDGTVPEYLRSCQDGKLSGTGELQTLFSKRDLPTVVSHAVQNRATATREHDMDDLALALKLSLETRGGSKTRRRKKYGLRRTGRKKRSL